MGEGMSSEFANLLRERKLLRVKVKRGMVVKEVEGAQADLRDAEDSLRRRKFKWATIQAYYSMFHSARGLLYHRGYREKSHHALLVALRELFANELGRGVIARFEQGKDLRQEADYGLKFSKTGAAETIQGAKELLVKAKEILKAD
ncbi:MAG: HEPN domain-containing protein [Nitrososphaerales archaeon]